MTESTGEGCREKIQTGREVQITIQIMVLVAAKQRHQAKLLIWPRLGKRDATDCGKDKPVDLGGS